MLRPHGYTVIDASGIGVQARLRCIGYGADTISLVRQEHAECRQAAGVDTVTNLKATDTIVFTDGGSASDLTFSDHVGEVTHTDITYASAATTLKTDLANNDDEGTIKVSFDGGTTTKKIAFSTAANGSITQATDVDYYVGHTAATLLASTDANLLETGKYTNISTVSLTAAAKGVFIGAKDATTAIDANRVSGTDGLQIWGGSTESNIITLGTAGSAADTVWFGTLDGKNKDTVKNFTGGFTKTSDVLKLYDTAALTDLTFTKGADGKTVNIANGKSNIDVVMGTGKDQLKVMLSDGTVKKVATDVDSTLGISVEGADVVIGAKATAATNVVNYGADQTDAVTVNLLDTGKYINITDINMTGATGDATVIGAKGAQSQITLGGGTNEVWGGSTDANTVTAGAGKDTIWFGATDGADDVKTFSMAKDTVKLYDVATAKEVFKKYTVDTNTTSILLKSADNTNSTLTLEDTTTSAAGENTIKAKTSADTAVKVDATGSGTMLTFATDTQIYASNAADTQVTVGSSVSGTVTMFLDNGGWTDAGDYYFSSKITKISASASAANTVLIGRAATASTLTGGLVNNQIWGGGYASQDMQGTGSSVDTIWFGTKDGADKFSQGADKNDTIYLYDVASTADVTMTTGTNKETMVIGSTGSTLDIADTGNAALKGGLTFKLSTGSTYTYDATNKVFVAKA